MIDTFYSKEEIELRKKAHQFAMKYIVPKSKEYDQKSIYPLEIIKLAQQENLLNVLIPQKYGGLGLSLLERAIISEEFAWACSGIAAAMLIQDAITIPFLLSDNEFLKQFSFKEILQGKIMALAYTEEDAGSHITAIKTTAKKDGSYYILNGSKTFISSVEYASYVLVFAKIESNSNNNFTMFLVDLSDEGIVKHEKIETMGQRANVVSGFDMKNVRIPEKYRIFEENGIVKSMSVIEYNRSCCAALANGISRRALDETQKYVRERKSYGKEIWKHQAIGQVIANMAVQLEASRLVTWEAIKNMELNNDNEKLSSYAKVFATDTSAQICADALQIFGGNGYTTNYPIEKLYRDVKVCQIYEGTSQIHRNIIVSTIMNAKS